MKIILIVTYIISFVFSHEVYKEIRIDKINSLLINRLIHLNIDLDHVHMESDNSIKFAVSESDLHKIESNLIKYEIIHDDLEVFYQSRLTNDIESRDFEYGSMGGYYTFNEIVENLDELYQDYPNLVAEKISIGQTLEGREIWALKMSDNPNIDEDEPEVLYTGLHHAREPMSYMNLFYYMNWLVENYDSDPVAQNILNQRELWFVPALNPDGLIYNQTIAPSGGGMQRKNGRETCNGGVDGVDLNRNYGYAWNCQGNYLGNECETTGSSSDGCNETYRGLSAFSEPETQAMKDFVEAHNFILAFNYHSYSNLLLYPFGYTYNNPMNQNDLNIFDEIGQELVSENNYYLGTGVDILYPVNGEACDWMYGDQGIFAYTPEVGSGSDGFWPATSRILPLCEENLYANQYLALAAGTNYNVNISIINQNFIQGESYPMDLSVANTGLLDASGNIYIDIITSNNLIFDDSQLILDNLSSGSIIDFGSINFEVSSSTPNGSIEDITVNIYDDNNGVSSSSSLSIIIGEPEILFYDDFESEIFWNVGAPDDDATAGIWEVAIPEATFYDGNQAQPGSDYSENGVQCFLTGAATLNNSVGFDDVDGGKTTLFSPNFDLSEYNKAFVSYWRWYTNDVGDNPGTDYWQVSVSSDAGQTWTDIEYTNQSQDEWVEVNYVMENDSGLSNSTRFRFVAEDIFNDGDVQSGGSIIEAAIDDFKILIYNDNTIIGDVNYDGILNVLDLIEIVSMILALEPANSVTDVNEDGILNIQDIIILVNIIIAD